ncbi:hypothetical protein J6590_063483 [Homalodisca vitripennis]|nr:hypothetical protein J6590_063483 [Homalodisca vitripennis]
MVLQAKRFWKRTRNSKRSRETVWPPTVLCSLAAIVSTSPYSQCCVLKPQYDIPHRSLGTPASFQSQIDFDGPTHHENGWFGEKYPLSIRSAPFLPTYILGGGRRI